MGSDMVMAATRSYIEENFLYMKAGYELKDDDLLLQKGIVDSMGVIEILEFLRDEFGVVVDDDDITEENLGTLNAIGKYVSEKLTVAG